MQKRILVAALSLAISTLVATAQDTTLTANPSINSDLATPRNMFEVGLNGGAFLVGGDVSPKISYGAGIHFRKALDYIFSLRADFLYGNAMGENSDKIRNFESQWMSGTGYGVFSLNSLRWDKPVRSTNLYVMAGAGMNSYETTFESEGVGDPRKGKIERDWASHIALGAGLSFRLGQRMNIGIEQQAFSAFGNRADKVDGIQFDLNSNERSVFRDIVSFTNLAINFNIGSPSTKSEPLYWINPLDKVLSDLNEVKNRPEVSLEDADNDGVIDAIDQELNTPAGAIVDTKGRTLDSDRDGVADHLDQEPFLTPRPGEQVNAQGVITNPDNSRGGGVTEERVIELIDQALQNREMQSGGGAGAVAEWFLPMIHFPTDSYVIKYADYGNLASIARMMKSNPNIRLVVTGFTDATGPEEYNAKLSYSRANAVIDHFVNNHGISRGRFVLQYKGKEESLVPRESSMMNRRVEFRVAGAGDYEMQAPTGGDGY